jgi:hypothetical protein
MKYLEALKRKNLGVENLSKTLQKKIQELNFQILALKDIENTPQEDLEKSDLEDIILIKKNLQQLDSYIEHKINIFDPVKYEEKLAKVSLMTKVKKEMKEGGEVKEVEKQEEEPVVTKVLEAQAAPIQSNQIGNTAPIEEAYIPTPTPKLVQDTVQETQPTLEQHEEDEFERKGDGKPKKMTTGLILMGVGAFFLTWGAVNFFKSRR